MSVECIYLSSVSILCLHLRFCLNFRIHFSVRFWFRFVFAFAFTFASAFAFAFAFSFEQAVEVAFSFAIAFPYHYSALSADVRKSQSEKGKCHRICNHLFLVFSKRQCDIEQTMYLYSSGSQLETHVLFNMSLYKKWSSKNKRLLNSDRLHFQFAFISAHREQRKLDFLLL